jgi:5'-3' exonuclease
MKDLVIIDSNYIAYRSFYGARALGPDSVYYGYARLLQNLFEHNSESTVLWCFDVGGSKRAEICREYKSDRRKEMPPEEAKVLSEVKQAIDKFRTQVLPAMGFENVYGVRGFEADDLIARLVKTNKNEWKRIVSSDADLYQLLDERTSFQPLGKPLYTLSDFRAQYNIEPDQWARVKAIAGCKSDGIPGVKGVGEKTAVKFLRNEATEKQRDKIESDLDQVKEYYKLTKLPFKGTPQCTIINRATLFDLRKSINIELRKLQIHEVSL